MTQTPPEHSGNRREPTPDQTADAGTQPEQLPPYAADPTADPSVEADAAPAPPSRRPTRTQAWLASGAAAVLLASGLGGFAVGRATAGDDDATRVDQQGGRAGLDRDGDGRGFQGGPGVGPGEGIAPPDDQLPDRDDDGSSRDDDGTDDADT
jgi:hypothetical protein